MWCLKYHPLSACVLLAWILPARTVSLTNGEGRVGGQQPIQLKRRGDEGSVYYRGNVDGVFHKMDHVPPINYCRYWAHSSE